MRLTSGDNLISSSKLQPPSSYGYSMLFMAYYTDNLEEKVLDNHFKSRIAATDFGEIVICKMTISNDVNYLDLDKSKILKLKPEKCRWSFLKQFGKSTFLEVYYSLKD